MVGLIAWVIVVVVLAIWGGETAETKCVSLKVTISGI